MSSRFEDLKIGVSRANVSSPYNTNFELSFVPIRIGRIVEYWNNGIMPAL
ncbi:MAG: hypothetical protein IID16_10725 [Candidatus Marinimicrobia bacterium]|nr:hypothetical protein [Candidatus Neomarinimicrobiota bacterium]